MKKNLFLFGVIILLAFAGLTACENQNLDKNQTPEVPSARPLATLPLSLPQITFPPKASAPSATKTPGISPRRGSYAPDFQLKDLNGNKVLLKDFRGKVVLLNFWASWCPACREEMPSLEVIYKDYKDKGFEILAIDIMEDRKMVETFMEKMGLSFAALLDSDGKVSNDYRVVAIPTTFVIDRRGIIQRVFIGAVFWDHSNYRNLIEDLLAESSPALTGGGK